MNTDHQKVYFYHLKKCGGTSLNGWLDLQVEDTAVWNSAWSASVYRYVTGDVEAAHLAHVSEQHRAMAISAFYLSSIVHSHAPMRQFVPPATFSFTILRDPVSRLLSQISDWRRLGPADYVGVSNQYRECMEEAQRLRVQAFLEKHARGFGRQLLNNYFVRALAASRLGMLATKIADPGDLLPIALESLERDFDVVGLAEHDEATRHLICARLGWCPAVSIPRLNDTGSASGLREEAEEARAILAELTEHDAKLYARARALFDSQCQDAGYYDIAAFESRGVIEAVRRLRAHDFNGRVAFSVREPVIGFGFHGRDAAGTPHCAVWTGPDTVSRLYMPVPASAELSVCLWVRGYANEKLREQLKIRVAGQPISHRFESVDGYRDCIVADVSTTRSFLSIEIELETTVTSGESGQPGYDARRRGICLDRYGWSFR
ncbi:sulfotransferase family 2 domain-containing protein [Paraburkholderia sp. A3BS-1L]|uniref:hypothetical protein n=1 Tax=Paraburkholderia sp. A3BS-1L TaxID=3028375 RepID=UPI003DA9888C